MIYLLLTVIFQVFIIRRRGKIRFPEGVHSPCEYYELLQELIQDITKYYQTTKFQTDSLNFTQVIVGQRNVKISTICVRVSTYYFFVRRPQNEFPRPIWKSRNPKCITLLYIGYFAASIRAAKSHFCPPAGKRQLPGRCAKRSCRLPAPSSRKIVYWPWPVKKKASDHMFVNLGFALADNYMSSETFLILLTMGRNILFCGLRTKNFFSKTN